VESAKVVVETFRTRDSENRSDLRRRVAKFIDRVTTDGPLRVISVTEYRNPDERLEISVWYFVDEPKKETNPPAVQRVQP
jgi:hypothetical protein